MQAGKLNKRVKHYQQIGGKSGNGAPIKQLSLVRTTWAAIDQVAAASSEAGERVQGVNRYQVTLRHRKNIGVSIGDWLHHKTHWLKVIGVDGLATDSTSLMLDCEANPAEPPPEVI